MIGQRWYSKSSKMNCFGPYSHDDPFNQLIDSTCSYYISTLHAWHATLEKSAGVELVFQIKRRKNIKKAVNASSNKLCHCFFATTMQPQDVSSVKHLCLICIWSRHDLLLKKMWKNKIDWESVDCFRESGSSVCLPVSWLELLLFSKCVDWMGGCVSVQVIRRPQLLLTTAAVGWIKVNIIIVLQHYLI